jgi:restriction endonuclease Mrr
LAPSTPTSPHGEMLEYILSTEPSSFEGAIDSVLEKLSDEIDSSSKKAAKSDDKNNDGEEKKDSMSLTLYKRIEDIKRMDRRRAVEDAMYASIIHKVS